MTQKQQLLNLFKENHNVLTLGQILQTNLAAEYRARMTDLRNQGTQILFSRGKTPSQNTYTLLEIEPSGQILFL